MVSTMNDGGNGPDCDLLEAPDQIAVERALAEFRAGRPVLFAAERSIVALPVDGVSARRLASFFARRSPFWLAVTARRARALGLETEQAVCLPVNGTEQVSTILAMAAENSNACTGAAVPALPAAAAALLVAKLAERLPALLIADPGSADERSLITVNAASLADFQRHLIDSLAVAASSRVPLDGAETARFIVFRNAIGRSAVAVIIGEPDRGGRVLVRVHSACLTGDVFGSRRCDCGDQLELAVARAKAKGGIILYLDQEGRGLGLINKMRAYALQDAGLDTVDANLTLGFEDDERDYRIAARMLELLGVRRVVLLTNNPAKLAALSASGIQICGRMPLEAPINDENRAYLTAKAMRAGHHLKNLLGSAHP
jgi:GTP cyclohydrolase II